MGKVPDRVKDSEFWKEKVKPIVDKILEKTKLEKVREVVNRIDEHMDMREEVDRTLSFVDERLREGIKSIQHIMKGIGDTAMDAAEVMVYNPAAEYGKKIIEPFSPELAAKWEKAVKKELQALKEVKDQVVKLPQLTARLSDKAMRRDQLRKLMEDAKRDPMFKGMEKVSGTFKQRFEKQHEADFGKGLEKVKPLYDKAGECWEDFRGWLDKHGPWQLRRIKPLDLD